MPTHSKLVSIRQTLDKIMNNTTDFHMTAKFDDIIKGYQHSVAVGVLYPGDDSYRTFRSVFGGNVSGRIYHKNDGSNDCIMVVNYSSYPADAGYEKHRCLSGTADILKFISFCTSDGTNEVQAHSGDGYIQLNTMATSCSPDAPRGNIMFSKSYES